MSNKTTSKAFGYLLTFAASINEAAFSFVGMIALLHGTPLSTGTINAIGIGSGLAALSIESEVFLQNISHGLGYAFTAEGLKLKTIRDLILTQYNSDTGTEKNKFLIQYAAMYLALQKRIEAHSHDQTMESEIETLQSQLYWMDKALLLYFEGNQEPLIGDTLSTFDALFQAQQQQYFETYEHKRNLMTAAILFTVLSLPGCFFASAFVAKSLLVYLGAAGAACCGGVITIAAVAVIAYLLMMYNTFAEMIYNDLPQKYWNQLKGAWYKENATTKQKFLTRLKIILVTALFTGLIVLLALATAGTWVKSGMAGQVFLFSCCNTTVELLIGTSALLYTAITVIFNIKNISKTISMLSEADTDAFLQRCKKGINEAFMTPYKQLFKDESATINRCSLLLPLAVIAYGLQLLTSLVSGLWFTITLTAHCVSEGVITDKGFLIGPITAATANGLSEFGTDLPYIINGHGHTQNEHKPEIEQNPAHRHGHSHGHGHCGHGHRDGHKHGHEHKPKTQTQTQPAKIDLNPDGQHTHAGILTKLFFVGFLPVLLINYSLCRLLTNTDANEAWKTNISAFWSAQHTCGGNLPAVPEVSGLWQKQQARLEKMQGQKEKAPDHACETEDGLVYVT